MRKNRILMLAIASAFASQAFAVDLYNTVSIDMGASGLDIFGGTSGDDGGFNPSAVTTDGTNIFVAGYNSTGATADTAVVRITDAFTATPGKQKMVNTIFNTSSQRGASGLDYNDGVLYVARDNGANTARSIGAYNAADGSVIWEQSGRFGADVAWDATSGGVGYLQFSSGRRHLRDASDGSVIYDGSNGMIIYPGSGSTLFRSLAYDNAGNLYARAANGIYAADRNGENSTTNVRTILADDSNAAFVNGQNLIWGSVDGGTLFYNDRPNNNNSTFMDSVLAMDTDGVAKSVSWFNEDGSGDFFAKDVVSNSYYDFAYDEANGRLVVMDFTNRYVHVFETNPVPEPATMTLLGLGALAAWRKRRSKKA